MNGGWGIKVLLLTVVKEKILESSVNLVLRKLEITVISIYIDFNHEQKINMETQYFHFWLTLLLALSLPFATID